MSKVRTGLVQFSILIICLIIMEALLERHYVEIGECAVILYYKPLTLWDRLIFLFPAL